MSNILSVFNPPPARDLPDVDCLPCTAIQGAVSLFGGSFLVSGIPFRDSKLNLIDIVKHPLWWQRSVRGFGIGVIGFGVFRISQSVEMWKNGERL